MEVDVHGKFFIPNILRDSEMGGLGEVLMVQTIRSHFILGTSKFISSFWGWIEGLLNRMI